MNEFKNGRNVQLKRGLVLRRTLKKKVSFNQINQMTFEQVHESNEHLLLRCVSGSRAYGLSNEKSDTDIRGIYILPQHELYGLIQVDQLNNPSSDIVYYELKKLMSLLVKNNPNILELLAIPEDSILYKHPLMSLLKPEDFLSKTAALSFGRYAFAQIEKARGLNKKIVNPMEKKRKGLLDFCWIGFEQGSLPLKEWLTQEHISSHECGCVAIDHMKNCYHLFKGASYKGITDKDDVQILLSSVEKNIQPDTMLYCHIEGFQKYCVDYNEYWKWVENRNEARYESTMEHGKNYDAKNMMHTFRLLNMAYEIATEKRIITRRPDREFLLKIRQGEFEYDDLVSQANEKMNLINEAFAKSDLPDQCDELKATNLLIELREKWYHLKK